MRTLVAAGLPLACVSACSAGFASPVTQACLKLAGVQAASTGLTRQRCLCIDINARQVLEPDTYELFDDLSRQVLADGAPAKRVLSSGVALGRFAGSHGRIGTTMAMVDVARLSARVAKECSSG